MVGEGRKRKRHWRRRHVDTFIEGVNVCLAGLDCLSDLGLELLDPHVGEQRSYRCGQKHRDFGLLSLDPPMN